MSEETDQSIDDEQPVERSEPTMEDVLSGYDYWGINKDDVPDEIKQATLDSLKEALSPEGVKEGRNVHIHATDIIRRGHEDSADFVRALQTIPGLTGAMGAICAQFVELLEDKLGLQIRQTEGEHDGMPANVEIAGVISTGVELCMALGYIAKQSLEFEEILDGLWGETGVATKEQVEKQEADRTSNEGLEDLGELPDLARNEGGECMDCGAVFETDAALTKHALSDHMVE